MADPNDLSRSTTIANIDYANPQLFCATHTCPDESTLKQDGPSRQTSPDGSMTSVNYGSTRIVSVTASAKDHLLQPITKRYTNFVIAALFFTSGLIDSVAFNSWSCFVSMQTGNTIFTALGLTRQPVSNHPAQYLKSLVSIGSFCVGAFFFATLHRVPFPTFVVRPDSPRPSTSRGCFACSFAIQFLFIVIAASLVTVGLVSNQPFRTGVFSSGNHRHTDGEYDGITSGDLNWADLAPIALLAFQASGQVSLSRVLGINELPTTVLSTLYYDFMSEVTEILPHKEGLAAWKKVRDDIFHNEKRNRRFAGIAGLFLGGVVGGFMFRSAAGMCGALWFAAGMKLAVALAWVVWPAEQRVSTANPV